MVSTAAFFDLDRTLLLGGSGPLISQALREQGLLSSRSYPAERALFGFFNVFGETLPSILLTRQGARAARGWPLAKVEKAAAELVEPLVAVVERFAIETLAEHKSAGRKLVLATTTPYDLVKPFADYLGFDGVLATRYRVDKDGCYDGTIDGEFVWSAGKARLVQVWARANLVELADSYAYSDSVFDIPMLSKVGYPVAVNPDPRLFAYATAKGWPRLWFNAPPGVPKPVDVEPQAVLGQLVRPEFVPWVKIEVAGLENVAGLDGAVLAGNHRSYLDPLLVAHAGARIRRPVRFLAKKEITDAPVVGAVAKALGAIPVDRGSGSEQPRVEAARALRAGELVAVFPQGTIPRGHEFFESELKGRPGAVRLALETGTPLVPIGIWGTEKAWPRNSRLPYVLNLADPPTVTVTIGQPYHASSDDHTLATEELMAKIVALLPHQSQEQPTPTPEELAATFPS